MKFLCGSCRQKYEISDEKVRGKILTIRCKTCKAKVVVRESLVKAAKGRTVVAPLATARENQNASDNAPEVKAESTTSPVASTANETPVSQNGAARAAQASANGSNPIDAPQMGGSMALANAVDSALGKADDSEFQDMPTSIGPSPLDLSAAGVEWYVAIDGVQSGPFAFAEITRRVESGNLEGRNYVWHDRMDDWRRIREVDDLLPLLTAQDAVGAAGGPSGPVSLGAGAGSASPFLGHEGTGLGGEGTGLGGEGFTEKTPGLKLKDAKLQQDLRDANLEELDSALNDALGIEGEGQTALQRTGSGVSDPTVKARGSSEVGGAAGKVSTDDLRAFSGDDLFASVPRATDADDAERQSTRFFVNAAGMNKRSSQNKLGLMIGLGVAAAFLIFMALWATGIVRLSLPGLGNPFENLYAEAELYDGEGVDAEMLKGLTEKERKAVKKRRKRRRAAAKKGGETGGFVDDGEEVAHRGSRGSEAQAIGIDSALALDKIGMEKMPEQTLIDSDLSNVPAPDTGTLDESAIVKVVESRKKSVRMCLQQARRANDNLSGKLVIEVTLQPSGRVSRAKVKTPNFRGSRVARCVVDKIRGWRFPSFQGEPAEFEVPFILE